MTIWRILIACWIPEATNTHSEHVILLLFHCNNGCTNAPQCYVTRTLPVFFFLYKQWRKAHCCQLLLKTSQGLSNLQTHWTQCEARLKVICQIWPYYPQSRWSKWPRGSTRGSGAARSLGLRIWIPLGNVLS